MKVLIKKLHPDAVIPKYAKPGDAGMDLVATSMELEVNDAGRKLLVYGTGLAVEIPEGYVGLVYPRSSVSKTALMLANSVGVIDSGYRGEIKMKFAIEDSRPTASSSYKIGDRVAQIMIVPYPTIEFEESTDLSTTERGVGGFGSTGIAVEVMDRHKELFKKLKESGD